MLPISGRAVLVWGRDAGDCLGLLRLGVKRCSHRHCERALAAPLQRLSQLLRDVPRLLARTAQVVCNREVDLHACAEVLPNEAGGCGLRGTVCELTNHQGHRGLSASINV